MADLGEIGYLAAGATGTPAKSGKSGKAAGKQKTELTQKEAGKLSDLIKNYSAAMEEAKMLDKLDGKEDGKIDMGKIAGALTGKTASSLRPISVDAYVESQIFPAKLVKPKHK